MYEILIRSAFTEMIMVLILIPLTLTTALGFPAQRPFTTRIQHTSSSLLIMMSSSNPNPRGVERVSICMGELCKCQEEDNAESIMNELMTLDLPYVVEDAPCLGACGQGSMVSIDYEDGDFALVTGLKETLDAIGVEESVYAVTVPTPVSRVVVKEEENDMTKDPQTTEMSVPATMEFSQPSLDPQAEIVVEDDNDNVVIQAAGNQNIVDVTKNSGDGRQKGGLPSSSSPVIEEEHGAVGRMRSEALQDTTERINPWVNMALYIGKKVKDSVVGG